MPTEHQRFPRAVQTLSELLSRHGASLVSVQATMEAKRIGWTTEILFTRGGTRYPHTVTRYWEDPGVSLAAMLEERWPLERRGGGAGACVTVTGGTGGASSGYVPPALPPPAPAFYIWMKYRQERDDTEESWNVSGTVVERISPLYATTREAAMDRLLSEAQEFQPFNDNASRTLLRVALLRLDEEIDITATVNRLRAAEFAERDAAEAAAKVIEDAVREAQERAELARLSAKFVGAP